MRRHFALILISTLFIGLTASIAGDDALAQVPGASPVKAKFDTDARLDRHVNVDATGVPLEQLFRLLSTPDLELNADSKCAEQRLQISIRDRPIRAAMHAIADLLPGYWKPYANGHGYSFYMAAKAITQREEWWRLYMRQHDAALETQRLYVLQKLNEKPKPISGEQLSPEQYAQVINTDKFYYGLSPELKTTLADHMIDTLMYGLGILSFSDSTLEEGSIALRFTELPVTCQQATRDGYIGKYMATKHLSEADMGVRISNDGLNLTIMYLFPFGQEMQSDLIFSAGQAPYAAPLGLRHEALAALVSQLGKRAPTEWKQLATFQEKTVWPNDLAKERGSLPVIYPFGPPRLAEYLNWLKDKSKIEYVSDYYDNSGTVLSEADRAKVPVEPLKVELDRLAYQHDISWKAGKEGIYLFRNNRWYRDDGLQVPLPMLREFTRNLQAHPPLKAYDPIKSVSEPLELKARMDLEARIVTSLTPFQIATGLEWAAVDVHPKTGSARTVFPFAGFADRIQHERYTTLFYESLSDSARDELIAGRLPFALLSAKQRQQAIFLIPALLIQASDKPIWLRLNDAPKRAMGLMIPGGTIRGVRLELVTPALETTR